jgi:hypothetical protein
MNESGITRLYLFDSHGGHRDTRIFTREER